MIKLTITIQSALVGCSNMFWFLLALLVLNVYVVEAKSHCGRNTFENWLTGTEIDMACKPSTKGKNF
jgi:hypothetical protein